MTHERGNILFLILLAVVLFAALSYAVTSSMRGGGKDATEEAAQAKAAAINQYAVLMQNEFQRFLLKTGYNISQIDLIDPGSQPYFAYGNNSACTVPDCNFFSHFSPQYLPDGPVSDSVQASFRQSNGESQGQWIVKGITNMGTSEPEIIVQYQGIDQEVCAQVNILNKARTSTQSPFITSPGSGSTHYMTFANYVPNLTPASSPTNFGTIDYRHTVWCSERTKAGYPASANVVFIVLYPR